MCAVCHSGLYICIDTISDEGDFLTLHSGQFQDHVHCLFKWFSDILRFFPCRQGDRRTYGTAVRNKTVFCRAVDVQMGCKKNSTVPDICAGAFQLFIRQCHIKADHHHVRHLFRQPDPIFAEIIFEIRRPDKIDFFSWIILFQILDHHIAGCDDLFSANIASHFCQFINIGSR